MMLVAKWSLFSSTVTNGSNGRSVVVMDNAAIHHMDKVAKRIQSSGAFLPPCSPDHNPIEESFAKLKAFITCNEVAFNATTSPLIP